MNIRGFYYGHNMGQYIQKFCPDTLVKLIIQLDNDEENEFIGKKFKLPSSLKELQIFGSQVDIYTFFNTQNHLTNLEDLRYYSYSQFIKLV